MTEEPRKTSVHTRKMDAYRQILRFIAERALRPGDHLPPQKELGVTLNTCQATLQAAMALLVEDGVLERRRKVGTVVRTPSPVATKREIWRVGIVMPPLEGSLFFPLLTTRLHSALSIRSVADRTYFLSPLATETGPGQSRSPSDFTGLASDLESELLDAIITPTRLKTDALCVVHVGSLWHADAVGIFFDEAYLLEDSVSYLLQQSRKDILCVFHHAFTEVDSKLKRAYSRMNRECKASGVALDFLEIPNTGDAGVALRQHISTTNKRPDGVVISNDVVAMQFCEALLGSGYCPDIVTPTNLQLPLSFALPVTRMAFDIEEMSARAVRIAMDRIYRPEEKGEQKFLRHLRIERQR